MNLKFLKYGNADSICDHRGDTIVLNEINTLPGFTSISMYPKLWEATGLAYDDLLDELIDLGIQRHKTISKLKMVW